MKSLHGDGGAAAAIPPLRNSCRSVTAAAIAGLVFSVALLRAVFLLVEVRASLGCRHWVFAPAGHRFTSIGRAPESLDELIEQFSRGGLDDETAMLSIKAMLSKMDGKLQAARRRAATSRRLASLGVPQSMHCVSMKLAEEYYVNAGARLPLPSPEHAQRLADPSRVHIAVITDNVLAAAVAIASTVSSATDPEQLVLHVVTDRKSYAPMHAWFALHHVNPSAAVEVRSIHQFAHRAAAVASIARTLAECRAECAVLDFLKMHLPQLFPEQDRIILLDADVVVRKDFAALRDVDLNGSVIGAAFPADGTSPELDGKQCAWLWGVNAVDLAAWRRTNITETFQQLLRSKTGPEAAALLAFSCRDVRRIAPTWHLAGLGRRSPAAEDMAAAAVLHFSGPAKPWMDIGIPELRQLWRRHLNDSDELLRSCGAV